MEKNKERNLLELITDYSKLQHSDSEDDQEKATKIATEIRQELWITGEIESETDELQTELEKDIRHHAHVDGKVVRDY